MDMFKIIEQMENNPYTSVEFRQCLEDHLFLLKEKSTLYNVAPVLQHRFTGNFYGLLADFKSIPYEMYWVTMRCNDFVSPIDYREGQEIILVPDTDYFTSLYQQWSTKRSTSV